MPLLVRRCLSDADAMAFELGACRLQQRFVLDPGRTCAHARKTAEAAIEVHRRHLAHGGAGGELAHQIDAAPGGVHLLAVEQVGRAGRKAKATMHAVREQRLIEWVAAVEDVEADRVGKARHHQPPTKRPGPRMPFGSNWAFTRSMRSSPGTGP